MKRSNLTLRTAEPEQNNVAGPDGVGVPSANADQGLAAALVELQAIERFAFEDELLRRSASVAAAMMLQDTIVTVLTLLLELERLSPTARDSSAFHELASQLASAAVAEAELSNAAILSPAMGNA